MKIVIPPNPFSNNLHIWLLTLTILGFYSTTAFARQNFALLGYSTLKSEWNNILSEQSGANYAANSGKDTLKGPFVKIQEKRYFLGAKRVKGDFNFEGVEEGVVIENSNGTILNQPSYAFSRQETEYYVGYDLGKSYSLLAGKKSYKFSKFEPVSANRVRYTDSTHTFEGNFYGISAHTERLRAGHTMYFATYRQSKLEEEGATLFGDAEGRSWEVGAVYFPARTKYLYSVSYSAQEYEFSEGGSEEFTGWNLAIAVIY